MRNTTAGKILLGVVLMGLIGLIIPVSSAAAPPTSPHVVIFSTFNGSNELLYVPLNTSGVDAYPVWHVYLYGEGSFTFKSNSTVLESGYSLGAFNFTYTWNLPGGAPVNASLVFAGVTYTFNAIITGPLSNQAIESVSVSSSYPGQAQFLTVAPGVSGALMYPNWTVTMESTQNVSYSIYENGQEIASGYVLGKKVVNFNVSGSPVTVSIGLGPKVFTFRNEVIASVPIQKYYGPKPPSLAYTVAEYEYGIARAFVASVFGVIIALFTARKYVLEHRKREVRVL